MNHPIAVVVLVVVTLPACATDKVVTTSGELLAHVAAAVATNASVRLRVPAGAHIKLEGTFISVQGATVHITSDGGVIDGQRLSRVFYVSEGARLFIEGLHITRGHAGKGDGQPGLKSGAGGCVTVESNAVVTMTDCTISHCTAQTSAGGVYVDSGGVVNLVNSEIKHCVAPRSGGASAWDERRCGSPTKCAGGTLNISGTLNAPFTFS